MSKQKKSAIQNEPSVAEAAGGSVAVQVPSEVPPAVSLKEYVIRITAPQGEPIAYSVWMPNIEAARNTFTVTVTERNGGTPPVAKPPKRFVTVIAAKTAEYQGRKLDIPVHAVDDEAAIEQAKADAVAKFMFQPASITEVRSGNVVWKARVIEG